VAANAQQLFSVGTRQYTKQLRVVKESWTQIANKTGEGRGLKKKKREIEKAKKTSPRNSAK